MVKLFVKEVAEELSQRGGAEVIFLNMYPEGPGCLKGMSQVFLPCSYAITLMFVTLGFQWHVASELN